MIKISISDYSVTIVQTNDDKYLLINKHEQTRVASNFKELIEILEALFAEAREKENESK